MAEAMIVNGAGELSWTELLKLVRNQQTGIGKDDTPSSLHFMDQIRLHHFPRVSRQLSRYGQELHRKKCDTAKQETGVINKNGNNSSHDRLPTKDLIVETRAALRFATSCLANESWRARLQKEAVVTCHWHQTLCFVVCQPGGDSKCRVMSARMLSNLVTCNHETAAFFTCGLTLSPSEESVTWRIRKAMSLGSIERSMDDEVTLVDIMVSCARAGSRDALGAVVAALHNSLVSLHLSRDQTEMPVVGTEAMEFAEKIASSSLLISTLLRHMLPVDSIKQAMQGEGDDFESHTDDATNWTAILIEKLCRMGMISLLYGSAGGASQCKSLVPVVTPEQIVLLHCVGGMVDEATHPIAGKLHVSHPLGGDGGDQALIKSLVFLAEIYCMLRKPDDSNSQGDSDVGLTASAFSLVLEILASSLGVDGSFVLAAARLRIGRDTTLVSDVGMDLGKIVDTLSFKNSGRKARDLMITNEEQQTITRLVRLVGNLCFCCRENQDMLRGTLVPFHPTCTSLDNAAMTDDSGSSERTALHVLLSCTSFATGCFTLREWAIVALRNVLENNLENQTLVEQLEAQQPLQSSELEQMGIRVDMDKEGQVRVVPAEMPNEAS